jgi:hypothetical protein
MRYKRRDFDALINKECEGEYIMNMSPPKETFYQSCDPDKEEIVEFLKICN